MVEYLDPEDLCEYLEGKGISSSQTRIFVEQGISGKIFLLLQESDLTEICPRLGDKVALRQLLKELQKVSFIFGIWHRYT